MKIDFYDLFSLHTPKDFSSAGEENYITAAVKSRVMENIPANTRKPVRIKKIGKAFLAAAAAVVVLVTGTLAASALGLIDLEKIFGGMFKSGTEHLAGITAVPQNVTTTGDDRLSFRVLGIAGTETEFVGSIEIKRNDGGVFPQYIQVENRHDFDGGLHNHMYSADGVLKVIDETTAIYNFRGGVDSFPYETESIIGRKYTVDISRILDVTELTKLIEKYDVYIDDEEDAVYFNQLMENENVILDGGWTITFPIEYNTEYRKVKVNDEPLSGFGISSSVITEVEYSAISLDIYLDDVYGQFSVRPNEEFAVFVKLNNGKEYTACHSSSNQYIEGGHPAVMHYYFKEPIDIDSVESITIGDIVIPVK